MELEFSAIFIMEFQEKKNICLCKFSDFMVTNFLGKFSYVQRWHALNYLHNEVSTTYINANKFKNLHLTSGGVPCH
jgi:hypothetical protein